MEEKEIYLDMENRMNKTVEAIRKELSSIRTGRASISLVDTIMVDYYGTMTPLKQIASIGVPDARQIAIQVWDKAAIQSIEKAINKSNIGISPVVDGQIIRLNMPPLNEERRKELAKIVKKLTEDGKVAIRNIRRDANDRIKSSEKKHELSEDDSKRDHDRIQKVTDNFIQKIDQLYQIKEKEILEF